MKARDEDPGRIVVSGTDNSGDGNGSQSPTERTALLSAPGSVGSTGYGGHQTGAATTAETGDDGEDSYSEDEEINANESVRLLASTASVTVSSALTPEPFESAMLMGREILGGHHVHHHHRDSRPLPKIQSTSGDEGVCNGNSAGSNVGDISRNGGARDGNGGTALDVENAGSVVVVVKTNDRRFLIDTDNGRFWRIFLGILLTYFIACFDGTIMASSHPVITSYFHSSNSASWLSTAFLLTSTTFQPMLGRLSDSLGRKVPYLVAIFIFAGATVSMTSFILARAVCGLGAGGMMSMATIIISDIVDIQRRGFYQGFININYGISSAAGAALGGVMADKLGWRWEFGVQVPVVLICFVLMAAQLPDDIGIQEKRESFREAMTAFDYRGSILLTTSTTFLILGINLGGNVLSWSHPFVIASLAIFVVFFPTCLYVESKAKRPIMPLVLLHSAPRANIIFSNFIASLLMNAILFNVPLFFQAVLLTSATESGLYLVVPTVVASVFGTATSLSITYLRYVRWPIVTGASLYLIGTTVLVIMQRGWPSWAYLLCLVPSAMAQGFQFPSTFLAVLAVSQQSEQAVVSSTLVLWRALGNVLGVATSSLVMQNALLRYLRLYVQAGDRGETWKAELIERVRSTVEAVAALDDLDVREQVVRSYAAALRLTFGCSVVLAAVSLLLVIRLRLPRLPPPEKRNT